MTTAAERIANDADCKNIFDRLLNRGIDKRLVHNFQQWLLTIPGEWKVIKNETIGDQKKRREKLANKIKSLADEIASDVDARMTRIYDEKSIFTDSPLGVMPAKPTISSFLADFAEHIEQLPISEYRELYETSRPANKSPKIPSGAQYAKKRIFEMLTAIGAPAHGRNKDTATLVNILFNLSEKKKVTGNDVTKMLDKKERRGYFIDEK